MVYHGRVQKGVVMLDEGAALPEGAEVKVEPILPPTGDGTSADGFLDAVLKIAETMEGLPPDLARNHDHYIHGRPRR